MFSWSRLTAWMKGESKSAAAGNSSSDGAAAAAQCAERAVTPSAELARAIIQTHRQVAETKPLSAVAPALPGRGASLEGVLRWERDWGQALRRTPDTTAERVASLLVEQAHAKDTELGEEFLAAFSDEQGARAVPPEVPAVLSVVTSMLVATLAERSVPMQAGRRFFCSQLIDPRPRDGETAVTWVARIRWATEGADRCGVDFPEADTIQLMLASLPWQAAADLPTATRGIRKLATLELPKHARPLQQALSRARDLRQAKRGTVAPLAPVMISKPPSSTATHPSARPTANKRRPESSHSNNKKTPSFTCPPGWAAVCRVHLQPARDHGVQGAQGAQIRMLVDSGAAFSLLSKQAACAAGIQLRPLPHAVSLDTAANGQLTARCRARVLIRPTQPPTKGGREERRAVSVLVTEQALPVDLLLGAEAVATARASFRRPARNRPPTWRLWSWQPREMEPADQPTVAPTAPKPRLTGGGWLSSQEAEAIRMEALVKAERDFAHMLKGLESSGFTSKQAVALREVIKPFKKVFLPSTETMEAPAVRVRLAQPNRPPSAGTARVFDLDREDQALVEAELKRLAAFGKVEVVQPDAPPGVVSSVFVVHNKKPRPVYNMVGLNKQLAPSNVALPSRQSLLDQLQRQNDGASFWLAADLSQAYHQVRVHEEDRRLLRLRAPHLPTLQATALPFGLAQAPGLFSGAVEAAIGPQLRGLRLLRYLDDVFGCAGSFDELLDKVRGLLTTMQQARLTLGPAKFELSPKGITVLGRQVSARGLDLSKENVADVLKLSPPTTVKQLRSLLGAVNDLRPHLVDVAQSMDSLNEAQRCRPGEGPLPSSMRLGKRWANKQQQALEHLQHQIRQAITLDSERQENPDDRWVVCVDASATAWGATLYQRGMDEEKPRLLAVLSRKMPKSMSKMSSKTMELHAAAEAVKKWRRFLVPGRTTLLTDSFSVSSPASPPLTAMERRAWSVLMGARLQVLHIPARANTWCDWLSRSPCIVREELDKAGTDLPAATVAAVQTRSDRRRKRHRTGRPRQRPGRQRDRPQSGQERREPQADQHQPEPQKDAKSKDQPQVAEDSIAGIWASAWRQAQQDDKELGELLAQLATQREAGEARATCFWQAGGVRVGLDQRGVLAAVDGDGEAQSFRPVLPGSLDEAVVGHVHGALLAHASADKVTTVLRRLVAGTSLAARVTRVVSRCECVRAKARSGPLPRGTGSRRPLMETVMLRSCAVDLWSFDGHTSLTAMELASGFLVAMTVPDASAEVALDAFLRAYVPALGTPRRVRADNGFKNSCWIEWAEETGVELSFTASHAPTGNSRLERAHRRLNEALRARRLAGLAGRWSTDLAWAVKAYNIAPGPLLDLSPFRILTGMDHPEVSAPPSRVLDLSRRGMEQRRAARTAEWQALARERVVVRQQALERDNTEVRAAQAPAQTPLALGDFVIIEAAARVGKQDPRRGAPHVVVGLDETHNPNLVRVAQRGKDGKVSKRTWLRDRRSLKKIPSDSKLLAQDREEDKEEEEAVWEVEQIVNHRNNDGEPVYRVKWRGFGEEDNTWEPGTELGSAAALVADYWLSRLKDGMQDQGTPGVVNP